MPRDDQPRPERKKTNWNAVFHSPTARSQGTLIVLLVTLAFVALVLVLLHFFPQE